MYARRFDPQTAMLLTYKRRSLTLGNNIVPNINFSAISTDDAHSRGLLSLIDIEGTGKDVPKACSEYQFPGQGRD
jgi:hypothetical protein